MLCLTRKDSQTLVIDDGRIVIHVVKTSSGRVRLGVVAPKDCRIVRGELLQGDKECSGLSEQLDAA